MDRARVVIGSAVGAGRGRAGFLFGLAALVFVPLGLLDAAEEAIGGINTDRVEDVELVGAVAGAAVHAASALVGEILYTGAVAIAVVATPAGIDPSLREIIRETRWGVLIAIDLLFVAGSIVGFLLLVVPGLIFFARYVLVAVVAEIEKLGVRDSFHRSAELSRGSRGLVFAVLFGAILVGEIASQLLRDAVSALGADHFFADWVAAAGGEILLNPVVALLSVALALQLGAALPEAGEGGTGQGEAATT